MSYAPRRVIRSFNALRDRWSAVQHALGDARDKRVKGIRSRWILLILGVIRGMKQHDVSLLAAGVAYYAVLSFAPLVLALVGILGLFADSERVQQALDKFFSTYLPDSSVVVMDQLTSASTVTSTVSSVVGVLGLLWTGTAMISALAKAINRAYGVHEDRPFYRARPRALLFGVAVLAVFAVSVYSTATIEAAARLSIPVIGELTPLRLLARLLPFLLTFTTFALVYELLPNTETHWRYTLPAALVAAIAFEAAKAAFLIYLNNANYTDIYGGIASVIVFMVWSYFSAFIVIIGAEISAVMAEMDRERQGPPQEMPTGP